MIKQTIYPRAKTDIPTLTTTYRWSGGRATVQLDSSGCYEVLVNGTRNSSQENSAKRDADYKPTVADVSLKMAAAYEKRDAEFRSMHKKAPRMQRLAEWQNTVESLSPDRYQRESFSMPRPNRDIIRKELEAEADIRFADVYDDRRKEKAEFVSQHEKEALAARMKGYEEIQAFFEDLQDGKETRVNAKYQKEYERKRKGIEDYINGEPSMTEQKIREILNDLNLPFRVEISAGYTQASGLLDVDIELFGDMNTPSNKANILASGKISVKDKPVKELEQFRTETTLSLIYYVAASLFNASLNIQVQRIKLWQDGKREGVLWVQFTRRKFSKLSMRNADLMLDYCECPRADALRVARGATQFGVMDAASFNNAIALAMADNGIEATPSADNSSPVAKGDMAYISYEDAKLLSEHTSDKALLDAVNKAKSIKAASVEVNRNYLGILKELKS